ncbi:hypothetical protein Vretimale_11447 [Volvox reticuliferus]|nr:hypothetical protein Vretifemale_11959 [Volvox reticuliferus]GIM07252.1 hypothetical protein Vretimale_11447 [Volvox reticuliferus]
MPAIPPALTPSQRGELELARTRAERVAAGRSRTPAGGGGTGATAGLTAGTSGTGAGAGGTKRHRGVNVGDMSLPNSDDDDDGGGGEHSDGELELSRLSPEEQERVLTARLATGVSGSSDKDARRLRRLLRNRVSAQQARERKKQYVSSLEDQIRDQQTHIGLLEKRLEMLESQNEALRNIIMTMRGFADNRPDSARVGGGPMGQSPGGATRPPADPAAGQLPAPRGMPQLAVQWQEGEEGGLPGSFGRVGTRAVQPAAAAAAIAAMAVAAAPTHMVPSQPDHVVPELPSGDHSFPLLNAQYGIDDLGRLQQHQLQQEHAQGQPSGPSRQLYVPRTRHSRAQLLERSSDPVAAAVSLAGVSTPAEGHSSNASLPQPLPTANALPYTGNPLPAEAAAAAPQLEECRPQDVIGGGGAGGSAVTAAANASPVAHSAGAVRELRYAPPVLGQLSPVMVVPGSSDAGMQYNENLGDGDAVPPRESGELFNASNTQYVPP